MTQAHAGHFCECKLPRKRCALPDTHCVQVIDGMRPYIQEQQAAVRRNTERMDALDDEVKRLTKEVQDAKARYRCALCCPLQR